MALKVTVGTPNAVKVEVGTSNTINTNIVSKRTSTKIETLADVDLEGVQDGYTLVYNTTTNKWEAVDPALDLNLGIIDGGTF
jgi:hypothetical protein